MRLKNKEIKRIRILYAKGWAMGELAKCFKVSKTTIHYHINKSEVEE